MAFLAFLPVLRAEKNWQKKKPGAAPEHLKVVWRFFSGFRHSGDATHASGRQGVRYAEPNGRFGILTTLDPPVRSESRGIRRLRP